MCYKGSRGIQVMWYVYHVVVQHNYTSNQVITVREPAVELLPNRWVLDMYRGADKSLAQPTSRCILFLGENISFDASLDIYIYSTNIPPIMIINRIYETQTLL